MFFLFFDNQFQNPIFPLPAASIPVQAQTAPEEPTLLAIKQQQRTKPGSSHSLEPKMSSSSRQIHCFHTYPVTGGISFQTVRYNLQSDNMQHTLEAQEVVNPFSAEQQFQQTNEGILEQNIAKFFA